MKNLNRFSWLFAAIFVPLAAALSAHAASVDKAVVMKADMLARAPASFGWATQGGGTTGGAAAPINSVHVVSNRAELIEALGGDNAENSKNDDPAIIFIQGTIDLLKDSRGRTLQAEDFADPEFDFAAYKKAFDPAVYGNKDKPKGPLEDARKRSQKNQAKHSVIRVGSNKTLFGLDGAAIVNGSLLLKKVSNVVIRNIDFQNSYDLFPMWSGKDNGGTGAWNSQYDLISIEEATNIWIDHSSFSDGEQTDDKASVELGKKVQHHDGLIDIKKLANYITITNSIFKDHDKTHLIGSTDKRVENLGHLKVTIAGNWYDNVRQRLPRVRFGEVHVLGNLFTPKVEGTYPFLYAFGAGKESRILAEGNVFDAEGLDPAMIVANYKGTSLQVSGTIVNGKEVDAVAAFNAINGDNALGDTTDWSPPYDYDKPDLQSLATRIRAVAGPSLMSN